MICGLNYPEKGASFSSSQPRFRIKREWVSAKEDHMLFLASLEWRISLSSEPWEKTTEQRLLKQWRANMQVSPEQVKNYGSAINAETELKASLSRSLIEKRRTTLFQASFRMGAAAPWDDHPR
jgi:hypothetical protein